MSAPKQVLTLRTMAWTILCLPDRLGSGDKALLARVREAALTLVAAVGLAKEFGARVRGQ